MPDPDATWNRPPGRPEGRWRRLGAALPMRSALLAVGVVWFLGGVWSFQEQSAFAASKGFTFPHLLPLVIDGFAVSMAGVAWAASLDARPAVPARLATLLAVAASSGSNGVWAFLRAHHDMVTVSLGVAVPVAANLAFEVLLAELRRQVQRRRGLPPPVAVPYPRLIRIALAPFQTFRDWRVMVLELTAVEQSVSVRRDPGPSTPYPARVPGPAEAAIPAPAPHAALAAPMSPAPSPAAGYPVAADWTSPAHQVAEAAVVERVVEHPRPPAAERVQPQPPARPVAPLPQTPPAPQGAPAPLAQAAPAPQTAQAPAVAPTPTPPAAPTPATAVASGPTPPPATPPPATPPAATPPTRTVGPGTERPARRPSLVRPTDQGAQRSPDAVRPTVPVTSANHAGPRPAPATRPTAVPSRTSAPARNGQNVPDGEQGPGSERRALDPRVVQLARHLANAEDADEVTGEMVGPLLNIDVAPRTGRRLLGQARDLVNRRAEAEANGVHDPGLSVIGGR